MRLTFALLLLLVAATASSARKFNPIQLRAAPGFGKRFVCNCESWRLAVEVNNIVNWTVVPEECVTYVGEYMLKPDPSEAQYDNDLNVLSGQALDFLQELPPVRNPNDTFLFDLINGLISDLEYYQKSDAQFGGVPFNQDQFNKWLSDPATIMKAVPYMSQVYYAAKLKGLKVVIVSSNDVSFNDLMEQRLKAAGISNWDNLILNDNPNILTSEFKRQVRAELLKNGSTVIGNLGDQWTGLTGGDNVGRVFKVPNPMYYVK